MHKRFAKHRVVQQKYYAFHGDIAATQAVKVSMYF